MSITKTNNSMPPVEPDEAINSKERYFKEFLEELASKIGGSKDGLKNAYLMRRLVENLNNSDKIEAQNITNLHHFNIYKKNINSLLENFKDFDELKNEKKNLEITQKFINKELEKFKKDFLKDRESYRNQITKVNTKFNPTIEKLQNKIELMQSSTDKRVTRHIQKNIDKLNELKKDHKELLAKKEFDYEVKRLNKFTQLHHKTNDGLMNVANVNLNQTNESLNINLTRKTIKSQYSRDVSEAYLKQLHLLSRAEVAKSKMEMFDNPILKNILKQQAYKKIKDKFDEKRFQRVSNKFFNELLNYQKSILFSKEEKLQIKKDGLEEEINDKFKEQIVFAINKFKKDNIFLKAIEENKAKDKEIKRLEKEKFEQRKAFEEAQRKANEEAQRKANEEAQRKIEGEAIRKANEEALRKENEELKRMLNMLEQKSSSNSIEKAKEVKEVKQVKKVVSDKKVEAEKKVENENKDLKNIDEEGEDYGIDR